MHLKDIPGIYLLNVRLFSCTVLGRYLSNKNNVKDGIGSKYEDCYGAFKKLKENLITQNLIFSRNF